MRASLCGYIYEITSPSSTSRFSQMANSSNLTFLPCAHYSAQPAEVTIEKEPLYKCYFIFSFGVFVDQLFPLGMEIYNLVLCLIMLPYMTSILVI